MLFASTIPFVGRQTELQEITAFSRHATEGDGLVALWIAGEAGIGKSRLIEQALPGIEEGGVIVLRVRFYPEALSSIFVLLHAALSGQPHAGSIARLPDLPEPMSVVNAIRRLARLRRVIIICEDVHVLAEDGEREFTRLLQGLVHEPIGLICTTRPGDYPAYQRVLPYIIQSLSLQPLGPGDLDRLLEHYGIAGKKERNGRLLHQITRGIPIIIRSILPELLEIEERESGSLKGNTRIAQFLRDRAAMSISSIVRETIGKLAPEERQGAAELANLGELFSERAAEVLLGEEAPGLLDSLRRNGIIALPMDLPKPLHGAPDDGRVWGFTHSLLHEELAASSPAAPERLLRLIQQECPLYSNRPLATLARIGPDLPDADARALILRTLADQIESVVSESRSGAMAPLQDALRKWFEKEEHHLAESFRSEVRLTLLTNQMRLGMYQPRSPEHRQAREELFRATEHPVTMEQAIQRAIVLAHIPPTNHRDLPDHIEELLTETEQLVGRFPSLAVQSDIINLLASIGGKIRIRPTSRNIERLRPHVDVIGNALMRNPEDPDLQVFYKQAAGHMLPLFKTEEELADRLRLTESLTHFFGEEAIYSSNLHSWSHMLTNCGRLREARTLLHEDILRFFRERPITGMAIQPTITFIEALMGAPLDYIEKSMNRLLTRAEDILGEEARGSYVTYAVALRLTAISRLLGARDWGIPFARRLIGEDPHMTDSLMLDAFVSDNEDLSALVESRMAPEDIRPILSYIAGVSDDPDEAMECIDNVLRSPIIYLERTFEIRAVISLLERSVSTQRNLLESGVRELIPDALRRAIDWCFEHETLGLIPPLLEDAPDYLPPREIAECRGRLQLLRARISEEFGWSQSNGKEAGLPVLKMIGSIAFVSVDGLEQRVQGARGRRILGLMIANSLMDRPQSPEEFRAVAAEGEADSGNTVRVAISRLRTMLGRDAIITHGHAPPTVNLSRFRVDLLEVLEILARCEEAIQTQKPRIAKTEALKALDMVGGEPPYPTLYGEFFEAARLDFELRLRQTILAVARFLCREEDYEEAADLLRNAFAYMPDDADIADELIAVLQLTGRNTEAISIKTRLNKSASTQELS